MLRITIVYGASEKIDVDLGVVLCLTASAFGCYISTLAMSSARNMLWRMIFRS